MSSEEFDMPGLARYLHLDLAKIEKLVKRQRIPGRRVGGEWRFSVHEVNKWLENEIGLADADELEKMEVSLSRQASSTPSAQTMVSSMLKVQHIIKPLNARTKGSVIREICFQASQLGLLWDEARMAELIAEREEMHSTALENGMALMHPRRPQASLIGDPFILLGVTPQGIPFGGPRGQLTDVFVLLASCEDSGHLQALARFSRIIQSVDVMTTIRESDSPQEIWETIAAAESELP